MSSAPGFMETNHSFEVRVTRAHANQALRWFLAGREGMLLPAVAILLIGIGVAFDARDGSLGWGSIVSLTLVALLPLVYVAGYVIRSRQMRHLLTRLGETPVRYQLLDSEIRTETILGSSALKWEVIEELWINPDLTLVFYARNGYTTLPTPQVPRESLQFLVSKVAESGGRIRDKRRQFA